MGKKAYPVKELEACTSRCPFFRNPYNIPICSHPLFKREDGWGSVISDWNRINEREHKFPGFCPLESVK